MELIEQARTARHETLITRYAVEYAWLEPEKLKLFSHPYIRPAKFYAELRVRGFSRQDALKETIRRLRPVGVAQAELLQRLVLGSRKSEPSDYDEPLGTQMSEEWAVQGAKNKEFDRVTTLSYGGFRNR